MGHPVNRRRPRLIDRQFQLGLAWRMMLVVFLLLLAGIAALFAPSMFILATGKDLKALEPAAREFLLLHNRVWPVAIFIFCGVFAYTLVMSHRIAGPIYRINAVLRDMIEGKYPEAVSLRKGDHLQDTADLIARLSRKLSAAGKDGRPESPRPEAE